MSFSLVVEKRQPGQAEAIRAAEKIPAIIYGPQTEPISVAFGYRIFEKLYTQAGESSLIDCAVEGGKEPLKVLVQDVQYDPVKGKIIHVDLRQIPMDVEMHATVELEFINQPPIIKEQGGTLVKAHEEVNVKCLPKDLVGQIQVDLAVLKNYTDAIHVKDLVLPTGIIVTDDVNMVLAKVAPPLTEDELKAMEEAPQASVDQIEVEKKGKEEVVGEEGADKDKKPATKAADKK
jgi:large subunit ribosomal protein L25